MQLQLVLTKQQNKTLIDAADTCLDLWNDGYIDIPLNGLSELLYKIAATYDGVGKKEG